MTASGSGATLREMAEELDKLQAAIEVSKADKVELVDLQYRELEKLNKSHQSIFEKEKSKFEKRKKEIEDLRKKLDKDNKTSMENAKKTHKKAIKKSKKSYKALLQANEEQNTDLVRRISDLQDRINRSTTPSTPSAPTTTTTGAPLTLKVPECPVCMEEMVPPARIHQCRQHWNK